MNLNDIKLNDKDTGAVNYVKARMAIEETMKNRADKRGAKMVVINHLCGALKKHSHTGNTLVVFPDRTKARF